MHTPELNIGDLCLNPNTKPTKYYIVHDLIIHDDNIYYLVADTRYGRKFKIKNNILIKPYTK